MKILVTGNCQSKPLAHIIECQLSRISMDYEVTTWPELHLIKESDLPQHFDQLKEADVVLAMPVGENYRSMPLGTSQVRERCKPECQFLVYPNLYFAGYYPHYGYLKDDHNRHITKATHTTTGSNPFGDYHDYLAISFYFTNLPPFHSVLEQFEAHLSSIVGQLSDKYKSVLEVSLNEIVKRDSACSFSVSQYIHDNYRASRLFHSFNHPSNSLLNVVADNVLRLIGLNPLNDQRREADQMGEYLGKPRLPILPPVASCIGITFPAEGKEEIHSLYLDYFRFLSMNRSLIGSIHARSADMISLMSCLQ